MLSKALRRFVVCGILVVNSATFPWSGFSVLHALWSSPGIPITQTLAMSNAIITAQMKSARQTQADEALSPEALMQAEIDQALQEFFSSVHGFVPETLVKTPSGYRQIGQLQQNDLVLALDEYDRESPCKILAVKRETTNQAVAVHFGTDDRVVTSQTQLFRCAGGIDWLTTRNFDQRTQLFKFSGQLHGVYPQTGSVELIALQLEHRHRFYVTKHDLIVHNFISSGMLSSVLGYIVETLGELLLVAGCKFLKQYFDEPQTRNKANFTAEYLRQQTIEAGQSLPVQSRDDSQSNQNLQSFQKIENPSSNKSQREYLSHFATFPLSKPIFVLADRVEVPLVVKIIVKISIALFCNHLDGKSRLFGDAARLERFVERIADRLEPLVLGALSPVEACCEGWAYCVDSTLNFLGLVPMPKRESPPPPPLEFPVTKDFALDHTRLKQNVDQQLEEMATPLPSPAPEILTPSEPVPEATTVPCPEPVRPVGCGEAHPDPEPLVTDSGPPADTPAFNPPKGCGAVEQPSKEEQLGCQLVPPPQPELFEPGRGCGPLQDVKKDDFVFQKDKDSGQRERTRPAEIPEAPKAKRNELKASSMEEVLDKYRTGEIFKQGKLEKTQEIKKGSVVWRLREKVRLDDGIKLDKGDKFYLDRFHGGDHIEWARGKIRMGALNLDGTLNTSKTPSAKGKPY